MKEEKNKNNIFIPGNSGHWTVKWILLPLFSILFALIFAFLTKWALFDTVGHAERSKIIFFGGNTNVYNKLSIAIQSSLQIDVEKNTEGSIDILERVSQTPFSFGVCQADVFEDLGGSSVRLVDTLYEEGLQILYPIKYGTNLNIGKLSDTIIDKIFTHSILHVGKPKSGTYHTTKKFLKALEKTHKVNLDSRKQENTPHYSSIIDSTILFFVSGDIDETLKNSLNYDETHKGSLFNVDESFVKSMPGYSVSQFKNITTIKTPALLICNKQLPQKYIDEFVEFFNNNDVGKEIVSPRIIKDYGRNMNIEIYKSRDSVFFLMLFIYFFLFFSLLKWIGSSLQKSYFFNKINKITVENFSDDLILNEESFYDGKIIYIPEIKKSDRETINLAIDGIKEIFNLRNQIGMFHNKSLLSKSNYTFLMKVIDNILNKLRKLISIGVNNLIEGNDFLVRRRILNSFMKSEFINRDDYDWLLKNWEANTIKNGTSQRLINLIEIKEEDKLKEIIIHGKLEEALNRVYNIITNNFLLVEGTKFSAEHEMIIQLLSRFNSNKREHDKGKLDIDEYRKELNQVRSALIELIKDAEKSGAIPKGEI